MVGLVILHKDWPQKIFLSLFEAAQSAPMIGPSRHAAGLVYKNRLICIGIGRRKTHPMMKEFSGTDNKITLHAEINCIVKGINLVGEDLSDYDLYVLRISRVKNISMSKPCSICQKAINAFGINQVHWSS